jgi:hypothetical protein
MLKRFRSLFRVLTRRPEFEERMTEELRFHLDQYTDDLVRSGMSPEKATSHAESSAARSISKRIAARHLAFTSLMSFEGS